MNESFLHLSPRWQSDHHWQDLKNGSLLFTCQMRQARALLLLLFKSKTNLYIYIYPCLTHLHTPNVSEKNEHRTCKNTVKRNITPRGILHLSNSMSIAAKFISKPLHLSFIQCRENKTEVAGHRDVLNLPLTHISYLAVLQLIFSVLTLSSHRLRVHIVRSCFIPG